MSKGVSMVTEQEITEISLKIQNITLLYPRIFSNFKLLNVNNKFTILKNKSC